MKIVRAEVLFNGLMAGILEYRPSERIERKYFFQYTDAYRQGKQPAISLTLPKQINAFRSPVLFSFFYGLLAEGVAKQLQCQDSRLRH